MSKQTEALKLALEALKTCDVVDYQQDFDSKKVNKAITALREALAEQPAQQEMTNIERHERNVQKFLAEQPAQQEPVAQRFRVLGVGGHEYWTNDRPMSNCTILEVQDLYTFPQPAQRTWVRLTDDEIWKFWCSRPEVPEGEDDSMEAEFVAAVRRVLAAPQPAQQEPAAIRQFRKRGCSDWYDGVPDHHDGHGPYEVRTLYTTPQPQQEPLTDEQLLAVIKKIDRDEQYIQSSLRHLARAIEAKLKEKNT